MGDWCSEELTLNSRNSGCRKAAVDQGQFVLSRFKKTLFLGRGEVFPLTRSLLMGDSRGPSDY